MSQFIHVDTPASGGTDYANFPAVTPVSQMVVKNSTGTDLELFLDGDADDTNVLPLADGEAWPITGITNASQVQVRRKDGDTTQVTVHAMVETP